jgi:hypothetical protein
MAVEYTQLLATFCTLLFFLEHDANVKTDSIKAMKPYLATDSPLWAMRMALHLDNQN